MNVIIFAKLGTDIEQFMTKLHSTGGCETLTGLVDKEGKTMEPALYQVAERSQIEDTSAVKFVLKKARMVGSA